MIYLLKKGYFDLQGEEEMKKRERREGKKELKIIKKREKEKEIQVKATKNLTI